MFFNVKYHQRLPTWDSPVLFFIPTLNLLDTFSFLFLKRGQGIIKNKNKLMFHTSEFSSWNLWNFLGATVTCSIIIHGFQNVNFRQFKHFFSSLCVDDSMWCQFCFKLMAKQSSFVLSSWSVCGGWWCQYYFAAAPGGQPHFTCCLPFSASRAYTHFTHSELFHNHIWLYPQC